VVSPHVRTVKTGSGSRAVQIVWSKPRGRPPDLQHVGSARNAAELAALKAAAWRKIAAGQGELDLGALAPELRRARIAASRSALLWGALETAWGAVGFDLAVGDEVFKKLVLARVVEPTSKLDSIRVLEELGVAAPSYSTIQRRLRKCVRSGWRGALEDACAAHADVSRLRFCLYDVTTLYWEAHEGDGFREPGFSKERRLEPQVVVGLLTTPGGFPLSVRAFEGTKAEVKTIAPVLVDYAQAHHVEDVTVVADAGMMSEANARELQDAGFGFIVGKSIPSEPFAVADWRRRNPRKANPPDGKVWAQRWDIGTKKEPRPCVVYYQWRAKRARRDLKGIDKTLAKARKAVAGEAPAKKNRFVKVEDERLSLNEELVADARARAGLRAYITDLPYRSACASQPSPHPAKEGRRLVKEAKAVIAAYHELWQVEHAFRMSKHDLAARPAFHRLKDSINAHLTVVFAALAVGQWIEAATGASLRRFVQSTRPIRQDVIEVAGQQLMAEHDVPPAVAQALAAVNAAASRGH
jgi:hypothetical protein